MNKRKILIQFYYLLAVFIIIVGMLSSILRAFTPWVGHYKQEIERYIANVVHGRATVRTLQTGWYWLDPVLKLQQVRIYLPNKHALVFKELIVGINIIQSLLQQKLVPGIVYVDQTHWVFQQTAGSWQLATLQSQQHAQPYKQELNKAELLSLISAQHKLIFKNIKIDLLPEHKPALHFDNIYLIFKKNAAKTRMHFQADLPSLGQRSSIDLIAYLSLNTQDWLQYTGEVYVSLHNIQWQHWRIYLPTISMMPQSGLFDGKFWLHFHNGQLIKIQSQLHSKDLKLQLPTWTKLLSVEQLDTDVLWNKNMDGWSFIAKPIQLTWGGNTWPNNAIQINYNSTQKRLAIYLQKIWLTALLQQALPWPENIQQLLAYKPTGLLHDTSIVLKNNQLSHILTGFSPVNWQAHGNIPGVHGLSGVLDWHTAAGHLQIDSQKSSLMFAKHTDLSLSNINLNCHWTLLPDNTVLNCSQFSVTHPDLTLSAFGSIEDWHGAQEAYHIHGNWRAEHLEQWLALLPDIASKPKLTHWLKKDIIRIAHSEGEFLLNGPIHIRALLQGVDLFFAKNWPLAQNIEALLSIDQRHLAAEIKQATLGHGVSLGPLNLSIADLGLDHEVLLIHGLAQATTHDALAYLMHSPLQTHAQLFTQVDWSGLMNLDLTLDVPLYPQNNTILYKGHLRLQNNQLLFKQWSPKLTLKHFNTSIYFDQNGVSFGNGSAKLDQWPFNFNIKSVLQPEPGVLLKGSGQLSMQWLQTYYNSAFLQKTAHGALTLNMQWLLPSNHAHSNTLELSTTMLGLALDLPKPFQKTAQQKHSMRLLIDTNPENGWLRIYIQQLGLTLQKKASNLWIMTMQQPELDGQIEYDFAHHILNGKIKRLYWNHPVSQQASIVHADVLPTVNLQIEDLQYINWQLGNTLINGRPEPQGWFLERFEVKNPVYRALIQGHWQEKSGINRTEATINASIDNFPIFLTQINLPKTLLAKYAELSLHGSWPGGFHEYDLLKVQGSMYYKFIHGTITDLSKSTEHKLGIGKVLNVLSLQTLPRRLQFDFSDLSHNGYAFDAFSGVFALNNGIMRTFDSTLEGPVASIDMKGLIDLIHKTLNLKLKVSPHLTSSLPVVATIAGGPIVGAAVWVANRVINQGMKQFIGSTYLVTGAWDKPQIKNIPNVRK